MMRTISEATAREFDVVDAAIDNVLERLGATRDLTVRAALLDQASDLYYRLSALHRKAFEPEPGRDLAAVLDTTAQLLRLLADVEHVRSGETWIRWEVPTEYAYLKSVLDRMETAASPSSWHRLLRELYEAALPHVGAVALDPVTRLGSPGWEGWFRTGRGWSLLRRLAQIGVRDDSPDEAERWRVLSAWTRFSVWMHYATVVVYPVAAAAAVGWWWMTGWWWPLLAAATLFAMSLWQVGVLWLLRQAETDSVRQRMALSAMNSLGSMFAEVGALAVVLTLWWDAGSGVSGRAAGIAAVVIAVVLVLDVCALWTWRRWLPPLRRRGKAL